MQRPIHLLLLGSVLLMSLLGCGSNAPEPTASPEQTATPLPVPTSTATPASPLAILVLPSDMASETYDLYQRTVYDLAQQAGYRFQVRNTLSEVDLEPTLKVVIAFPPDPGPGVAALAAAAPATRFLAINIPGVAVAGNVSVLANSVQTDVVAFMAGYIGAMITEDYRIGMVLPQGDPQAVRTLEAYSNGMAYFCGICRGYYYLPYDFPQSIEVPSEEDPANYGGYPVYLVQQRQVDFVYIHPALASPELLAYVGSLGAVQVGNAPQGAKPLYWAASMQSDVVGAIQAAWPGMVAGEAGREIQAPLALTEVDPTLLPPGKQAQAEEVLADLLAGRISLYSVP